MYIFCRHKIFLCPSNKLNLCLGIRFTGSLLDQHLKTLTQHFSPFIVYQLTLNVYSSLSLSSITKYTIKFSLHHLILYLFLTGENQPKLQDEPLKMPIPIFGLTTHNLKGSILTLLKASKSDEMNALLKAADVWLESLKVEIHHDHNFFVKDGKQWIEK